MSVGNLALVKNLEQDIENVGMCLFNLVKEKNRIRTAAYLFRYLTCLVIAYIARW